MAYVAMNVTFAVSRGGVTVHRTVELCTTQRVSPHGGTRRIGARCAVYACDATRDAISTAVSRYVGPTGACVRTGVRGRRERDQAGPMRPNATAPRRPPDVVWVCVSL